MIVLVKLVSIFLVAYGCVIILKPDIIKKIIDYFKAGNRLYVVAAFRIVLGLIFLSVYRACSIPWIILLFGIALLIGGVTVFLVKKEKIEKIITWFTSLPPKKVYILGIVVLALGALMALAA